MQINSCQLMENVIKLFSFIILITFSIIIMPTNKKVVGYFEIISTSLLVA